jgi:hypothetical protein
VCFDGGHVGERPAAVHLRGWIRKVSTPAMNDRSHPDRVFSGGSFKLSINIPSCVS